MIGKTYLNRIVDNVVIVMVGVLSFLYSFYHRYFAEIRIELPFLNFPIFIGEIILAVCILLLLYKLIVNKAPVKFNPFICLLIVFYAFVAIKAFYGYYKWSPLAFRNAALFYYSFYAVIGYYIFRNDLLANKFIKYPLLLFFMAAVIFRWPFKTHYIYFVIFALLIFVSIKHKLLRYACIALFSLASMKSAVDTLVRGRDITVASIACYTFLLLTIAWILVKSRKFKYTKQLLSIALVFIVAASAYFWIIFDRNEIRSLISIKEVSSEYARLSKMIDEKKEDFQFIDIRHVKLYGRNRQSHSKPKSTYIITKPLTIEEKSAEAIGAGIKEIVETEFEEQITLASIIGTPKLKVELATPVPPTPEPSLPVPTTPEPVAASSPEPAAGLSLHFDETDNSYGLIDSSPNNHKVAVCGNVHIDAAQSRFGGTSVLFDGEGDYLSLADSDDWYFGRDKFTIDFWARFNSVSSTQTFVSQWERPQGGYGTGWVIWWNQVTKIFTVNYAKDNSLLLSVECYWNPQINTWYRIAIIRNGTTPNDWYIFVDDEIKPLTVSLLDGWDGGFIDSDQPLFIGQNGFSNWFNGWLDEFRVYKGITYWGAVESIPKDSLLTRTILVRRIIPQSAVTPQPVAKITGQPNYEFESRLPPHPVSQPITQTKLPPTVRKTGVGRPVTLCQDNILFRLFMFRDMFEELFEGRHIVGLDFGNPFRSKSIDILGWAADWKVDGWIEPHNSYVHIIYRAGIIGLLFIIAIWALFFRMVVLFIKTQNIKGVLLASLVLYWLVIANFAVILELPYFAIPFWCTFGIVLKYAELSKLKQ